MFNLQTCRQQTACQNRSQMAGPQGIPLWRRKGRSPLRKQSDAEFVVSQFSFADDERNSAGRSRQESTEARTFVPKGSCNIPTNINLVVCLSPAKLTIGSFISPKPLSAMRTFVVEEIRNQAGKHDNSADKKQRLVHIRQQHYNRPGDDQAVPELSGFLRCHCEHLPKQWFISLFC